MTTLDMELAALRKRRRSIGFTTWARSTFMAWLYTQPPFDRRAIREPDERDVYWVRVQQRLAAIEATYMPRRDAYDRTDVERH
jgi:hypothetical protein